MCSAPLPPHSTPGLACSRAGAPGLDTADPQMDGTGLQPHGPLHLVQETDEQTQSYAPSGQEPG